jgi:hypothetical protein
LDWVQPGGFYQISRHRRYTTVVAQFRSLLTDVKGEPAARHGHQELDQVLRLFKLILADWPTPTHAKKLAITDWQMSIESKAPPGRGSSERT